MARSAVPVRMQYSTRICLESPTEQCTSRTCGLQAQMGSRWHHVGKTGWASSHCMCRASCRHPQSLCQLKPLEIQTSTNTTSSSKHISSSTCRGSTCTAHRSRRCTLLHCHCHGFRRQQRRGSHRRSWNLHQRFSWPHALFCGGCASNSAASAGHSAMWLFCGQHHRRRSLSQVCKLTNCYVNC